MSLFVEFFHPNFSFGNSVQAVINKQAGQTAEIDRLICIGIVYIDIQ